jgi:hypothetical protein
MLSTDAKADECYTPANGVEPIMKYLDKSLTYYECASGRSSSIVDAMTNNGFNIIGSEDRDFLVDDIPANVDVIITNPPYSIKDDFISRCYELDMPFALLLPVSAIQGVRRGKMFLDNGIEVLVLNRRIGFNNHKSCSFGVAWFCHKILPERLMFHE